MPRSICARFNRNDRLYIQEERTPPKIRSSLSPFLPVAPSLHHPFSPSPDFASRNRFEGLRPLEGLRIERRFFAKKLFTLCEITFHNFIRSEVNRLLIIICNDYIYDVPDS